MATPRSAHGVRWAAELDPAGAPDVYTDIGGLRGDVNFLNLSRTATEVTDHGDDIDKYVKGVLRRGEVPVRLNYDHGDANHQALLELMLAGTNFKCKFYGAGGTPGDDEVIFNDGFLTSWNQTNPEREGERGAEGVYRPSGSMVVDGVTYPS